MYVNFGLWYLSSSLNVNVPENMLIKFCIQDTPSTDTDIRGRRNFSKI
jgi:hypothetical protein